MTKPALQSSSQNTDLQPQRSRYRRIVLGILSATYAVNYIDRQILAILLQPIKAEFRISDTMLGLLSGPAFALFYATMGMPIAVLADRRSRKRIVAGSLALFSLMTLACAMVTQFWQLLIARILTGVGEAGTGPASQSLLSDLYPAARRGTALAIYAAGVNLGLLVAFLCGGWIAQRWGWRAAFLVASIPGLVLACAVLLLVREPERVGSPPTSGGSVEAFLYLWRKRSYRCIVLGTGMSAFSGYGVTAFVPSFLMRSHHLDSAQVGVAFALILGVGGGLGTYWSGALVDRLSRHDVRWSMYVPMLAALVSMPFWPVFLLSHSAMLSIAAAVIPLSLSAAFIAPCITTIQAIAPQHMRSQAAAIQLLIGNLIGLGLGPLAVGAVSDILRPVVGSDSLRYALFAGILASLASIFYYGRAARDLRDDLATDPPKAR